MVWYSRVATVIICREFWAP